MKTRNIRKSVFETNSSSTHSIHIDSSTELLDTIIPNEEGQIILTGGEFGWEYATYHGAETKANYLAIYTEDLPEWRKMLEEVLKEQTGTKEILHNWSTDYNHKNWSCIDHQSMHGEGGAADEAFESKEKLRQFVFNSKSYLVTDNDNH